MQTSHTTNKTRSSTQKWCERGYLICYPGNAGTNTSSLELIKLIINSVILRKGARFACIDIKSSTSTRQWKSPSTSVSKSQTFQKSLSWSTGLLGRKTSMGGSTLEFAGAAMGCPRLAFWPIASSAVDWKKKATTRPTQLLDFGNTSGVQSSFASSLTTLALSTSA